MAYTVVAYVVMAYIDLAYTIRRRGGIRVEHLHDLTYGYGRWRLLQQQQTFFGHMCSHNKLVITAGWRLPQQQQISSGHMPQLSHCHRRIPCALCLMLCHHISSHVIFVMVLC